MRLTPGRKPDARKRMEAKTKLQQEFETKAQRIHAISQLLKAYCLYQKDVQYVVQDNKVIIVDENTGRLMTGPPLERRPAPGRRGQGRRRDRARDADAGDDHDSELLPPLPEAGRHDRHGGDGGAGVLRHLQARRAGHSDQPARGAQGRERLGLQDPAREIQRGAEGDQGRSTAKAGRFWSARFPSKSASSFRACCKREGIIHSVLNAKYHQQEAEIVARAGQRGAVTIATNMAGRGTDIKLGAGRGRGGRPARASAPNATRRAALTASCAAVARARAIPARRTSSSRSKTI